MDATGENPDPNSPLNDNMLDLEDEIADAELPPTPIDFVGAAQNAAYEVIAGSESNIVLASAFAFDAELLGTNAHLVEGIASVLGEPNSVAVVVQHETGLYYFIEEMWIHPDYNGNSATSPDVGVLRVDSSLDSTLPIAATGDLETIGVLDEVLMCGFPGDVFSAIDIASVLEGTIRPRATCLTGSLTAVRPFDASAAATPTNSQLLQHDIPTTEGTSGSAILNQDGFVVAINAAGTTDEAGLNRFAPRSDTLAQLRDQVRAGVLSPIEIVTVPDSPPVDLYGILEGTWVLESTFEDLDPIGCMEFNNGTLIFYNAVCFVGDSLGRIDNLDVPVDVSIEGTSFVVVFSYTIIDTTIVLLSGTYVDSSTFDVYFTSTNLSSGVTYEFPLVMRKGSWPIVTP